MPPSVAVCVYLFRSNKRRYGDINTNMFGLCSNRVVRCALCVVWLHVVLCACRRMICICIDAPVHNYLCRVPNYMHGYVIDYTGSQLLSKVCILQLQFYFQQLQKLYVVKVFQWLDTLTPYTF